MIWVQIFFSPKTIELFRQNIFYFPQSFFSTTSGEKGLQGFSER